VTLDTVNNEKAFILDLEDNTENSDDALQKPPIDVSPFMTRHKKNRKRRVGVGKGRENTVMPDMAAMLSPKNKYNKDIHGQRTESKEYQAQKKKIKKEYENLIAIEPRLSPEMESKFRNLKTYLGNTENSGGLLTEEIEISEQEIQVLKENNTDIIEDIIRDKGSEEVETIEEKTLIEVFEDET
jgi:hypothetical protein